MKKLLLWILLFALICSFASCANELREQEETDESTAEQLLGTEQQTQIETEIETESSGDSSAQAWHTECQFCGGLEGENRWFIARVIDSYSVVPVGTDCFEDAEAGGAWIDLSYSGENLIESQGIMAGNVVRVTYDGYVMETYPVRIVPTSIEIARDAETVQDGLHLGTYYLPYKSDLAAITFYENGTCSVYFSAQRKESYTPNYWIEDGKVYLDIETASSVHVFTILENALVLDPELTTANLWDTMLYYRGPVAYFLPDASEQDMLATVVMADKGLQSIPEIERIYGKYSYEHSTNQIHQVYAFKIDKAATQSAWSDRIIGTDLTFTYADGREMLVYTQGMPLTLNEAYDKGYLTLAQLEELNEGHNDCSVAHSFDQGIVTEEGEGEIILYTCKACGITETVPLPDDFSFTLTYKFDLSYDSTTGYLENGYNYDEDKKCETTLILDHDELMDIYRILYNGNLLDIKGDFLATDQWVQPSYRIEISYTVNGETTAFVIEGASHTTYSEWHTRPEFCYAYEKVVNEFIIGSEEYGAMPPNQNMYS
ncbi:MAG: hypothetical protein IJW70_08570 [Clostridia bacterium]|nr:hypothetical protein [Clostridia bacterium]